MERRLQSGWVKNRGCYGGVILMVERRSLMSSAVEIVKKSKVMRLVAEDEGDATEVRMGMMEVLFL